MQSFKGDNMKTEIEKLEKKIDDNANRIIKNANKINDNAERIRQNSLIIDIIRDYKKGNKIRNAIIFFLSLIIVALFTIIFIK